MMNAAKTEIAGGLNGLVNQAELWAFVLIERAKRLEGAEESDPALRGTAGRLLDCVVTVPRLARDPHAGPREMLLAADRALSGSEVIRAALVAERQAATEPDDASWLSQEISALDRLLAARADLVRLPPPGDTPTEELRALQEFTRLLGAEITIEFECAPDGATRLSAVIGADPSPELPEELEREAAERAIRLADPLIRCEIPDWDAPPGANGRLRILPDEPPWLDAVDHAEDWLLERHVDPDALAEASWDAPERRAAEDGAPEP
jgi:hypothetical protein